jgi:hypothetical protein
MVLLEQKRILAFLKLCAVLSSSHASTKHTIFSEAVGCLDADVDDDVAEVRKILKTVQETCLAEIVQAQRKSVSVFLQVLYSLHQEHVQFLIGDYKARVLETHGPDAFSKRVLRQGVVDIVHARDIRPARDTKQARGRHDPRRRRRVYGFQGLRFVSSLHQWWRRGPG